MYFIVLLNIRFDGDLNVTLYYNYSIEYLKLGYWVFMMYC